MTVGFGFIYYLQNPLTGEIFYVGSTQISLKNRLRTHYQHLREFERGLRKSNRRYEYLKTIKPVKATIHLLEIVTNTSDIDAREIFYIKHFRKINPNLTNMTDGGKGNHTSKYYTESQLEAYSKKISKANKGKPKPNGFAQNLSKQRQGLNNPASKEMQNWLVCFDTDGKPIKMFKYGFQVNNFLSNKHAYGNIYRNLKNDCHFNYGFKWFYFKDCNKDVQDIVQFNYESN